jgi:antitoxin (DNA-binding transcriptional repressor) of toxin-antitoxin stability system
MRYVSVRELRSQSAAVWRDLEREGELVITSNGKPIAILSPTQEQDVQRTLDEVRRARVKAAVARLHEQAQAAGVDDLTMGEISREVAQARGGGASRVDPSKPRGRRR